MTDREREAHIREVKWLIACLLGEYVDLAAGREPRPEPAMPITRGDGRPKRRGPRHAAAVNTRWGR